MKVRLREKISPRIRARLSIIWGVALSLKQIYSWNLKFLRLEISIINEFLATKLLLFLKLKFIINWNTMKHYETGLYDDSDLRGCKIHWDRDEHMAQIVNNWFEFLLNYLTLFMIVGVIAFSIWKSSLPIKLTKSVYLQLLLLCIAYSLFCVWSSVLIIDLDGSFFGVDEPRWT